MGLYHDGNTNMVKMNPCSRDGGSPSVSDVVRDEVGAEWCSSHVNLNDGSVQGGTLIDAYMQEMKGQPIDWSCRRTNGITDGDLYMFEYDETSCRGFGEAMGLALAYTAY